MYKEWYKYFSNHDLNIKLRSAKVPQQDSKNKKLVFLRWTYLSFIGT